MAQWDVFHADRLEVERSLSTAAVRQALAEGRLRDDDLIRPAGATIGWARLADFPALLEPEAQAETPAPPPPPPPPLQPTEQFAAPEDEDEDDDELDLDAIEEREEHAKIFDVLRDDDAADFAAPAAGAELGDDDLELIDDDSALALPVDGSAWDEIDGDDEDAFDPQDEDEAAAEFTLARGRTDKVEELDLAAMVDVAFQLVLFFLVTATTVLYKSLEVPKPNPDSPAAGATQGRSRTMDDLKNDYILVEIDPAGVMKIDREPVAAEFATLVERLRQARESTGRKAMLLSAEFATPHRNAVLAYDAANEIGLGIAIARPKPPDQTPAAPPPPERKAARGG